MKLHLFHVREAGQTFWVLYSPIAIVKSKPRETQKQLLARWVSAFGTPSEGIVRVKGFCRPAEAVAHMAALKQADEALDKPTGKDGAP